MTIIKHHTGAEINIEGGDWYGNWADKAAAINALETLLQGIDDLTEEALDNACSEAVRAVCGDWAGDLPYLLAGVR